jgi:hypothetical protein
MKQRIKKRLRNCSSMYVRVIKYRKENKKRRLQKELLGDSLSY